MTDSVIRICEEALKHGIRISQSFASTKYILAKEDIVVIKEVDDFPGVIFKATAYNPVFKEKIPFFFNSREEAETFLKILDVHPFTFDDFYVISAAEFFKRWNDDLIKEIEKYKKEKTNGNF